MYLFYWARRCWISAVMESISELMVLCARRRCCSVMNSALSMAESTSCRQIMEMPRIIRGEIDKVILTVYAEANDF